MSNNPPVTVVIPAHKRPMELRRAIQAARQQNYPGEIDIIVVFDRADPDFTLQNDGPRPVRVLSNSRTPGLAGARNTGILAATGDLVAFCDDDDYWLPEKLNAQLRALAQQPTAHLVTCAIVVEYEGRATPRLAGVDRVTHAMLTRSRMSMLHSSTLLFLRSALLGDLGLINEDIPGSQNEDWDILLRSSRIHPIVHLDEPLVRVMWGRASYFSRRWDTKIASSIWMLKNHSSIRRDRRAAGRLMGQIAFAHASSGTRRAAWRWAARAWRNDPLQWRAPLSLGVSLAPRSGELALSTLHKFGRGV